MNSSTISLNKLPAKKQTALCILGMHRSGTSALARVCSLLGAELGDNLIEENSFNELGFWEHKGILDIHEEIFSELRTGWDDLRPLPDGWWKEARFSSYKERIKELLENDFSNQQLFALKEPRMAKLLPFWLEILDEMNISPVFAITWRPAQNVAKSLEARDWFSEEKSLLLWLIYNLELEKHTRNFPRVFTSYDGLISGWREVAQKIADRLSLTWPQKNSESVSKIDRFIKPDLRHHEQEKITGSGFIYDNCRKLAALLEKLEAGGDESLYPALDAIYQDLKNYLEKNSDINSVLYPDISTLRKKIGAAYTALGAKALELDQQRLREQERTIQHMSVQLGNFEHQVSLLKTQIDSMTRSISWKITQPLRTAARIYLKFRFLHSLNFYRRLVAIIRLEGFAALYKKIYYRIFYKKNQDATKWFWNFRPGTSLLEKMRKVEWPTSAPKFSVLMCVYNSREEWLKAAVESVLAQAYQNFELILVDDCSTAPHIRPLLDLLAKKDRRIKTLHLPGNMGVSSAANAGLKIASGDYVCFIDHDDFLEPQALYRFAETILKDGPDILYSDEALTEENIDKIRYIVARPQFSYDYYISHPYFVHFIGVRMETIREIGGFNERMKVSQDYDLILRTIEKSKKISHIPDVLYRWRTHKTSLGHLLTDNVAEASRAALQGHAARLGFDAKVKDGKLFNFYDIDFNIKTKSKVAVIIPTKNHGDILKVCIDSLEKTVPANLIDIYIINHDSNERATLEYLESIKDRHKILKYSGAFNFSALINYGAAEAAKKPGYSHYLILNNDIEAIEPGWLQHMLSLNLRDDVGIVGALLLYPDRDTIQHAGVVLGIHGIAEHSHKFSTFTQDNNYSYGYNGALLVNRDWLAVTAACMLIRKDAFDAVGGFDENLAVGFGDTDLCLRVLEKNYKVLLDSHAVLVHHESLTRGKSQGFKDPHPKDSSIFIRRYRKIITEEGDPYYSPLLYNNSSLFEMMPHYKSPEKVKARTVEVRLPRVG